MTVNVPDRFKAANAFWIGLGKIGLTPAAVLGQARVPVTVYDGTKNLVTTAQFFALWRAVGELSSDAAAGLKIATQIDVGNRPPSTMAAYFAQRSISEQVKWILKRLLAGARPDVSAVARELGLSDRTLQRRIDDDGTAFRKLLLEARQELAREYLNRPDIDVAEVAYLLGYEDSNSFYRAFRTWEGTTPSQLRAELKRPVN